MGLLKLLQIGEELGFDALQGITEELWAIKKGTLYRPEEQQAPKLSAELCWEDCGKTSGENPLVSATSLDLRER